MTTVLILTDQQATALQSYMEQLNELMGNANIVTLNGTVTQQPTSQTAKRKEPKQERPKLRKANKRRASLSIDDVIKIKEALADGRSSTELAKEYRCSYGTIFSIKQGKTWKDVVI